MTSLYEFADEILDALRGLATAQDFDEEQWHADMLEAAEGKFHDKVDTLSCVAKYLEHEAAGCASRAKKITARGERCKRSAKRLKNYVAAAISQLPRNDKGKLPTFRGEHLVYASKTKDSVDETKVDVERVPIEYLRERTELLLDKEAVMNHYREKNEPPKGVPSDAILVNRHHLVIRD